MNVTGHSDVNELFPMNLSLTIKVRNGKDPMLLVQTLTVNTFDFGISSHDMFIIGLAFTLIGLVLSI